MRGSCLDCGKSYPGLVWYVPDEIWLRIAKSLGEGELCPICGDIRLRNAGITVKAKISWSLGNLNATDMSVIAELEALDTRICREQASNFARKRS